MSLKLVLKHSLKSRTSVISVAVNVLLCDKQQLFLFCLQQILFIVHEYGVCIHVGAKTSLVEGHKTSWHNSTLL